MIVVQSSVKAVLRCTSGHNVEDRDRIESNQTPRLIVKKPLQNLRNTQIANGTFDLLQDGL